VRGRDANGQPVYQTIIGVVGHAAHEGLDAEPRVQRYLPYAQTGNTAFMSFVVRTSGDPMPMLRSAAAALHSVDKDIPLANPQTMDALMKTAVGQRRVSMILLGAFSALALLLASVGLYGVMSYSVSQRARELGVRMALGAARSRVLGLVVSQGMSLALLGIVIGVVGAVALTRLLGTQLYHVAPTDVPTFAIVATLLAGVSLAATLVPALKATRVDPVVALREE
jgi:putative ABC transport system permease protein